MHGQLLTIHIFKSEYQPLHGLTKYSFSVMSPDSPYYELASVIVLTSTICAGVPMKCELTTTRETPESSKRFARSSPLRQQTRLAPVRLIRLAASTSRPTSDTARPNHRASEPSGRHRAVLGQPRARPPCERSAQSKTRRPAFCRRGPHAASATPFIA